MIFHVDMDSFFASVEQQANPKLRGKPIAVSGDPKSRTVVAAASKEAKRFGVKSAMTIHEARQRCPQITFVLGDPDKYVEISRRIIRIFSEFTPDVEVASIDEAFLDVTGWCERYACEKCIATQKAISPPPPQWRGSDLSRPERRERGWDDAAAMNTTTPTRSPSYLEGEKTLLSCGAIRLAQEIKRRIRSDVGEWITCSIGIASNKRLAKLASDFHKPDGIVFVHEDTGTLLDGCFSASFRPLLRSAELRRASSLVRRKGAPAHRSFSVGGEKSPIGQSEISRLRSAPLEMTNGVVISRADLLASLKLRDLCGIGERIEARLRAIGITTIAELAAAPIYLLIATFGKYGSELHDMAIGEDDSVVDASERAPKSMGHATTLPRDIHTLLEIQPVVDELSEKIAARLRRDGYRSLVIHVTLRFRDFTSRSEQQTIATATDDGLQISREAMRILEDWQITKPIRLVGVSVAGLTATDVSQRSLFSKDERWSAAVRAMDAVNNRYGEWVVQRASLLRSERFIRKVAAAFRATAHLR